MISSSLWLCDTYPTFCWNSIFTRTPFMPKLHKGSPWKLVNLWMKNLPYHIIWNLNIESCGILYQFQTFVSSCYLMNGRGLTRQDGDILINWIRLKHLVNLIFKLILVGKDLGYSFGIWWRLNDWVFYTQS